MKGQISLEPQSFKDFLKTEYGETPYTLLAMFNATSSHPRKEFEAAMDYLRRKYRQREELRIAYAEANPFKEDF